MRRFSGAHARRPGEPPDQGAINTGIVFDCEGVEFKDGTVVITWRDLNPSGSLREFYSNFASFHEVRDRCADGIVVYWIDPEPEPPVDSSPGT